ncbi:hypothetical protein B0H13DRAFT_2523070 [Mycena leptocephala]|nr:hypothetical protein B0H13DRAFT_2523070 [Mycena leptocephala]
MQPRRDGVGSMAGFWESVRPVGHLMLEGKRQDKRPHHISAFSAAHFLARVDSGSAPRFPLSSHDLVVFCFTLARPLALAGPNLWLDFEPGIPALHQPRARTQTQTQSAQMSDSSPPEDDSDKRLLLSCLPTDNDISTFLKRLRVSFLGARAWWDVGPRMWVALTASREQGLHVVPPDGGAEDRSLSSSISRLLPRFPARRAARFLKTLGSEVWYGEESGELKKGKIHHSCIVLRAAQRVRLCVRDSLGILPEFLSRVAAHVCRNYADPARILAVPLESDAYACGDGNGPAGWRGARMRTVSTSMGS